MVKVFGERLLQQGYTLPHTYFLLSLVFYDETDGLKRLKLTLKIRKNAKCAIDQNTEALFLILTFSQCQDSGAQFLH